MRRRDNRPRRGQSRPGRSRPGPARLVRARLVRARPARIAVTVLLVIATVTGVSLGSAIVFDGQTDPAAAGGATYRSSSADVLGGIAPAGGGGTLAARIDSLQRHLRAQPRDARGWADLGVAYVEQARLRADPAYYPKAETVLARSLRLQPADNAAAVAGQAALAAARHDFPGALRLADRSLATNPYGERALAIRVDALVELGRYPEARRAAVHADGRRPGIPVFTRLAYVLELTGDRRRAERVLRRAAESAIQPGDVAYVASQRAELAWAGGDLAAAGRHFADALRADPAYIPALDGRARLRAARGGDADIRAAESELTGVVRRLPLPDYAIALGELFEADGRPEQAREQYAIVRTSTALARANGVATDLETALFEADHGDRAAALKAARAEWARRRSIHVADALAWALHVNGQDKEAIDFAERAAATGYRNALFQYHRGMIEKALGRREAARRSLTGALEQGPGFAPIHAAKARAALEDLERES
jgi:tetratricopeptide (TPR) repeat protein